MRISTSLSKRVCLRALTIIGLADLFILQYWMRRSPFNYDAQHAYIPLAQRLLSEGPAFFLSPEAIHVPPFAFVWPALFGADLGTQKLVSIALSLSVVAILFRTGSLLHSPVAGLLCAAAYAFSPLVWPLSSTAGVEPLFLFLTTCWIWCLAEGTAGRSWAFVGAGIAIGLAALTRATSAYFLPFIAIMAVVLSRADKNNRNLWCRIFYTHALAIVMVAPVVAANAFRYGLYAISTGAGAALFLGNHPLVYGFEQHYFDSALDLAAVMPPGMSHLDIRGDRMLTQVGRFMLATFDPSFVAKMYAHKLFAFLFVTNREWVEPPAYLRAYRILLYVLAAASWGRTMKQPVLLCVLASLAFQTVLHVPALFSFRYSVLTLDVGLCLLAGLGLAQMLEVESAARLRWSATAFACLGLVGVWHATAYQNFPQINLYEVPRVTERHFTREMLPILRVDRMSRLGNGHYRFDGAPAVMEIDLSGSKDFHPYAQEYVSLIIAGTASGFPHKTCNDFYASYRPKDSAPGQFGPAQRVEWLRLANERRAVIGGYWKLRMRGPGSLRLTFDCPAGTDWQITGLEIVRPTVGSEYRTGYLHSIGKDDWGNTPQ